MIGLALFFGLVLFAIAIGAWLIWCLTLAMDPFEFGEDPDDDAEGGG